MSDDTFRYAMYTLQTGHRPLAAFAEVFDSLVSSMVPRLREIENESGTTSRRNLEIALSDTAILMTYSLVEGFFYEEYKFYFNEEPKRGRKLEDNVRDILKRIGISNNEHIESGVSQISGLRAARHAIAHRNGALKETEISELQEHFGPDVETSRGYPVATVRFAVQIIQASERLVTSYSEAAFNSVIRAQQTVPPDVPVDASRR
ncbi:hypothetical protein [Ectothiorhodospira lacustris]|uniref:hypothetical protein n=1 Tax=Ectothiorhodospira lacustris TaxID=2899127 RepID=UPI001EE91BE9|nr:hypothetical protein [Ectothiorhodospira lacustris]MCG5501850.1 hypothetical protein [Ectothiorhodospira lacustris]